MDTKKHDPSKRKITLMNCAICFKSFEARNSLAKFCSISCKREYHRLKKKVYYYLCAWCMQPFETFNRTTKYCSNKCTSEVQRVEAIEKAKDAIPRHIFPNRRARHDYLRRTRIRANWVEDVKLEKLIERDKGVCQLCNEPVKLDAHYSHPLAATNDHIIPVSKGGEHSYTNCQLAHRQCNTNKNDGRKVKF